VSEVQCGNDASYRYTWPGRDESFICESHSEKLRAVIRAMGLYVQLAPCAASEKCQQKVSTP
jgi:hypothetical protein